MNMVGDIKQARQIGYKDHGKRTWQACASCGKERWVQLKQGNPVSLRCRKCSYQVRPPMPYGSKNPNWKGGTYKRFGYIWVRLQPEDFFFQMINRTGYLAEHRLVMAKHLGRCLHKWEIVHHKNGIKADNRLENLQLVTDDRHKQISILEGRINYLERLLGVANIPF